MCIQCSVPHPIQSILTSVWRRLLPESIYSSAWVGAKEFMALSQWPTGTWWLKPWPPFSVGNLGTQDVCLHWVPEAPMGMSSVALRVHMHDNTPIIGCLPLIISFPYPCAGVSWDHLPNILFLGCTSRRIQTKMIWYNHFLQCIISRRENNNFQSISTHPPNCYLKKLTFYYAFPARIVQY